MASKYIVHDITHDVEYPFYDFFKFDTNGSSVKQVRSGLNEATTKYNELNKSGSKCVLIFMYPNYKTGQVLTNLLESNV